MSNQREVELLKFKDKLEEVKMLIRVTQELKVFKSFKQFEHCSKISFEVCRQAQAWLGSVARVQR